MKEIIYSKLGDIKADNSGKISIGGFAADEYREKYGCEKATADEKTIFGAILETDDSVNSVYNMMDTALAAGANIIMFDICAATGKVIYHIRSYMRDKMEEITGLYETRICFMRK